MTDKYYCENPGCNNKIEKPQFCCGGFDCGCQGLPIAPPFCSEECYELFMCKEGKHDKT